MDQFRTAINEFGRPLQYMLELTRVAEYPDLGGYESDQWHKFEKFCTQPKNWTIQSELNQNCSHIYAPIFYELESQEAQIMKQTTGDTDNKDRIILTPLCEYSKHIG